MKELKLQFHSVIDLITNSSTEIFMDFSDSVEPFKELINEIFKSCGVNKTCDEVFDIGLTESGEDSSSTLIIKAKDEKYEEFTKLLDNFISSIELLELSS